MKSAPFDYVRPKTVAEASALLAQDGVTTAAIAGGQSLIPMLNLRAAQADLLVDLSRLDELKAVSETPESLHIGALTTHAAIEDGKIPDRFDGLMRRVAGTISYRAVRNHGTIGGSVALADPAADWPGCLIALGATVRIAGRNGTRQQPVADFVQGLYATTLAAGEIVLGFDVPRPDAPLRWGFAKVARKSGAFANSIAIVVAQGKGGPVTVVLGRRGAASDRPHRRGAATRRRHELRRSVARRHCRRSQGATAGRRRLRAALAHLDGRAGRQGDAGEVMKITVTLNGAKVVHDVEPRETLADFVRDRCGLTATHLGCEHGACGACTVVLDGEVTRACLMLAVMCDGRSIETLEGFRNTRPWRSSASISTTATACNAASVRPAC